MIKAVVFSVCLLGCVPAHGKSCDVCGKWSFQRFEYSGYTTTDCANTARHFYDGTYFIIDQNRFFKTYSTDSTPNEIDNVDIVVADYDSDENAQIIIVKSDSGITERFYKTESDTVYLYSDGCKFYFKRH